ncbi:hypothetical protein COCNU_11G001060 [Cocos nucifera]|uniref:Uncharacterized protein n=1 Tax=Cocos nucifera TaxID=13894 RepID=A0A8K0IN79_COCNU|nr:hypothetical protein COCNU_11G001060 [Cocos nucifera]
MHKLQEDMKEMQQLHFEEMNIMKQKQEKLEVELALMRSYISKFVHLEDLPSSSNDTANRLFKMLLALMGIHNGFRDNATPL